MTLLDIHKAIENMEGIDCITKTEVPIGRNKDLGTIYTDTYNLGYVLMPSDEKLHFVFNRHGKVYDSLSISLNEEVVFKFEINRSASDADVSIDLISKIGKKIESMYTEGVEVKCNYILESLSSFGACTCCDDG